MLQEPEHLAVELGHLSSVMAHPTVLVSAWVICLLQLGGVL